jgi:hypothetical protein
VLEAGEDMLEIIVKSRLKAQCKAINKLLCEEGQLSRASPATDEG